MNITQADQIQISLWLPEELIAQIAGYCYASEKNILMKVSKDFNACLKNRELIVSTNPFTVSVLDKKRSLITCARLGDVKNLSVWIHWLEQEEEMINSTNILGVTAFQTASDNKHVAIMKLLVEHGADVNESKPSVTPLHQAVYDGDIKQVQALLEMKADPNLCNYNGMTPLYVAIYEGNIDMVQLLCENGARKDQIARKFTPLCLAAYCCCVDIVKFFIDAGVDVNQLDKRDRATSLYVASQKNYVDVVRLLLEAKASTVKAKNGGWTPLHIASKRGHVEVVDLLLKAGARFNRKTYLGDVPLHLASREGHVEVVKLLLKAGALVTRKNLNGARPLHIVPKNNATEIMRLLLLHIASHEKSLKIMRLFFGKR